MNTSLIESYKSHHTLSTAGESFLHKLEDSIAQDLWLSAGGYWSASSIETFRAKAMQKLAEEVQKDTREAYESAWIHVIRDFHTNYWGERRLSKKEKKPETEEKKIFWELFSYIWILLQATLVTKTAIFYFGIKSAQEDSDSDKIYVILAILFSFGSLGWFAYRKSKKQ